MINPENFLTKNYTISYYTALWAKRVLNSPRYNANSYFCLDSGRIVLGTHRWVHIHDFRNCEASVHRTYISYGFTHVRVHEKFTPPVRRAVDVHVRDRWNVNGIITVRWVNIVSSQTERVRPRGRKTDRPTVDSTTVYNIILIDQENFF